MSTPDPITVELIGSALSSIVDEMGEALVRSSYSTNIKERRDCSTALFDRVGQVLCQAEHIPMHLGSFLGVITEIVRNSPTQSISPGDVFIANDPYKGGATHLPDIVLAEPIFVGDRHVAWAVNTAHHADFADRGHAHIYQEGIRIPPIKLYRTGELQEDIQALFLLNCQVPSERLSDLRAQMSANRLGVQRFQALCEKYGTDLVLAAGDALLDYAERKMRAAIEAIPDGTYSFKDVFDSNQIPDVMTFSLDLTISGSDMILKFDAPPQVRAGMNLVYTSLLAVCYYAVKSAVEPTVLPNAGLARPLKVEAPKGSILNCAHPAAVDSRISASQRVADVVHGALAQAIPGRISAAGNGCCTAATFNGVREDGTMWVYLETIGGGGGARPLSDGLSGIQVHMTNTSNLPVEALEREYPLTLLKYELVDGSGGVGAHRGGMGIRRVYRVEEACRFGVDLSRLTAQPWGLQGGASASGSALHSGDDKGDFSRVTDVVPGQILEVITPGGGGYGAPADRPLDEVKQDVKEQRLTEQQAKEAYPQYA